jgi:hypothetical protein
LLAAFLAAFAFVAPADFLLTAFLAAVAFVAPANFLLAAFLEAFAFVAPADFLLTAFLAAVAFAAPALAAVFFGAAFSATAFPDGLRPDGPLGPHRRRRLSARRRQHGQRPRCGDHRRLSR